MSAEFSPTTMRIYQAWVAQLRIIDAAIDRGATGAELTRLQRAEREAASAFAYAFASDKGRKWGADAGV